ncbi:hypothetical protein [Myxosarcina sp. GI1]|nr:hypothetical protein [Myxosarcina sp. GI1]
MLLIDTLLIGVIALAVYKEKTANAEQAELITVPVSDEEKAQKIND